MVLGRGWVACAFGSAGGELGLQAVEDGLQAELEAALGCRAVVHGVGCLEAGAQLRELSGDLAASAMWSRISSPALPPSRLSLRVSEAAAATTRALPSTKVNTVAAAWPACSPVNPAAS